MNISKVLPTSFFNLQLKSKHLSIFKNACVYSNTTHTSSCLWLIPNTNLHLQQTRTNIWIALPLLRIFSGLFNEVRFQTFVKSTSCMKILEVQQHFDLMVVYNQSTNFTLTVELRGHKYQASQFQMESFIFQMLRSIRLFMVHFGNLIPSRPCTFGSLNDFLQYRKPLIMDLRKNTAFC